MQQENNKCIICLLQIFKYSLQGQRFLFVKCTKKNGACFPKAYYSKFSLCICFFEMVMGMFGSFYFGKEISTFDSSILYKLKCSAFFITTAAIGNATLWNLRINSLKTFLLLLFFACNNYFSLSYDLQRNLKIYYLVQFVTYWFINILWLVVYVITFYITNGNYKALQIPMWTGITFFGSVYYELNAYMKILFIFFDKIVSFGKNLNKKIRFHKYLSMSHGIFIGEILWLRRSYDETIRIVENMTKYLSLMTIFAFALVIPCLISMACSSMQFILCYNCVSKDEIILLTEAIGFALPWILFGAYVLEKIGRLERKGEDITAALFRYRLNKLSQAEANQVEMLITTVSTRKPVVNISDLFSIGTALITSMTASVITYVLVALQFQQAWIKSKEISMKE